MEFRRIPQKNFSRWCPIIRDEEKFSAFCNDFHVIGMGDRGAGHLNASYFIKLLQNKNRSGCPMHRGFLLSEYQQSIFDHSKLWKLENNSVICTSMPYFTGENILNIFLRMKKEFSFPDSIQLKFLDSKYRFRPNGHYFFMIYDSVIQKGENFNGTLNNA